MENLLIGTIIIYSVISMLISGIHVDYYIKENINPFKDAKDSIKEIETIGDLIIFILLSYAWLIAVLFYGIVKVFYNRYTISLMNVRIKKKG